MKMNFDFNSKKFFILLGLICLLFLIVVINAFMYLPDDSKIDTISEQRAHAVNRAVSKSENIQTEEYKKTIQQENEEKPEINQEIKQEKKKSLDIKLPKLDEDIEIENVAVPEDKIEQAVSEQAKELSPEEKAEKTLQEAQKCRASKQYIKALDEYQKLAKMSSDKKFIAASYDGVASVYAINKRYGTALAYAIKAYNTYPTTEREMTLARLYYKTGDIAKATQRVNNILHRDFANDKW